MFRRLGVIDTVPVIDREDAGVLTIAELESQMTEDERAEIDEDHEDYYGQVVPSVEDIIKRELRTSHFNEFGDELDRVQVREMPIESYREGVETSVSRIDEYEHSTLMISSDVLFETDSSDLLEEADEELAAVTAELEEVEGGELRIVGHTDNDGTEEYNQGLSEERAESVRDELATLIGLEDFDVAVEGESFREPIADNESEEGMALNRRVELHFTPPTETIEIEIEGELPEALGEDEEYPNAVHTGDGAIEIESIQRIDDLMVGRIKVSGLEDVGANYTALTFGFGRGIGARGWSNDETLGFSQYSAYAPTLIHNNQRYYPLDIYLTPLQGSSAEEWVDDADGDMDLIIPLAERNTFEIRNLGADGHYTATVLWPAIDDETVTVDVTVPRHYQDELSDRQIENTHPWRITNVPIEDL
ncbi:OmpA family protein [Geomicrobium sp. JCM 19055]|uniref:OmpA family protein n=1 Tax=Geomicrobium sp. JCM 19055 TaxID=1460649 RepID=UPI000B01D0FB|nr:OmpA family protein [Geomicrobium sp. JCM 19055]